MQNKQLLVDLSPEQSALIEGGYMLHLHKIKAVKTGADSDGVDEAYLSFFPADKILPTVIGAGKVWGESMKRADIARINKRFSIASSGSSRLKLFDNDSSCNSSRFDLIGALSISGLPRRRAKARLSGGGSTYVLTYSVMATS
ncbi:MAG: hypothetical protein ACFE0J_21565 [Elainellaceae cyanobacterium]